MLFRSEDIVTQYAMTELELLGFLKMDFLGLKNLTLISDVIKYIKKNYEINGFNRFFLLYFFMGVIKKINYVWPQLNHWYSLYNDVGDIG